MLKIGNLFRFVILIVVFVILVVVFGLMSQDSVQYHIRVLINGQSQNDDDNGIPSIVHFVLGQGDKLNVTLIRTASQAFIFINYLAILAARRQLHPKKLYVHYHHEPNTFWWNQMKQDREIDATLMKSRLVDTIYMRPVDHHSHRADIIRLEVLMKYGGIYLDIDALALRSFDPLRNLSDVIMAHESDDENTACNAIILSKRNAQFVRRMYDAYQSFDQKCWVCHSVKLPGQLAHVYSNEVMVLPTKTFFRPDWSEVHKFYNSNDYDFTSSYASHFWNSVSNDHLHKLTPDKILNGNFTLARMLLQAIGKNTFEKLKTVFTTDSVH